MEPTVLLQAWGLWGYVRTAFFQLEVIANGMQIYCSLEMGKLST